MLLPCFEDGEHLFAALQFSFPPIVRLNGRDEVGAGDQLGLERGLGQAPGQANVGRCDENHRKSFRSNHAPS